MTDKLSRFLIFLTVFGLFFFDYHNDAHWPQWALLATGAALFITLRLLISDRIPVAMSLLFGITLINGCLWFEWRPNTWALDHDVKAALRVLSAHATCEWLLLVAIFYTQWRRIRQPIGLALVFAGLIHAAFLIFDQLAARYTSLPPLLFQTKGLLGNRSIGASFTAVWMFSSIHFILGQDKYDIWLLREKKWLIQAGSLLGVVAVAISVSSISYAALVAGLLVTAIVLYDLKSQLTPKKIALFVGSAFLLGLAGGLIDPEWYHHISRYDAWPMFYHYFKDSHQLTRGAGLGSFPYYGPYIQELNQYKIGQWWLWAHNDWLQLIFEIGYVGFSFAVLTYVAVLVDAFKRPFLLGAVVAYGVVMVGNYPLHIASTAVLGFWIAFESIWGKRNV